jgi:uncharacterized protein (DUF433 family)
MAAPIDARKVTGCGETFVTPSRTVERFAAKICTYAWHSYEMEVIVKDQDILGGTPVFRGARVPLQVLFDYLEGGEALEDFLERFPTVSRESAVAALEEAKQLLLARP